VSADRRPHAIHFLRRRMAQVSVTAVAGVDQLEEARALIAMSRDLGGAVHLEERALEILDGAIADARMIAVETAVRQLEPGHTRRARKPAAAPQPAVTRSML